MLKALHKLSLVEGKPEFHTTTRRMFRDLGKMEGGFKGWIISKIPSLPIGFLAAKRFAKAS
jgi:hypothetical protein